MLPQHLLHHFNSHFANELMQNDLYQLSVSHLLSGDVVTLAQWSCNV